MFAKPPPHATHFPTTPRRVRGSKCGPQGALAQQTDRYGGGASWEDRPVTLLLPCHQVNREIKAPVPNEAEAECPKEVWARAGTTPTPPRPSPTGSFPTGVEVTFGPALSSASYPKAAIGPPRPLGSAPRAAIGRRAGPRPIFLESSWKSVKGVSSGGPQRRTRPPLRPRPAAPRPGCTAGGSRKTSFPGRAGTRRTKD